MSIIQKPADNIYSADTEYWIKYYTTQGCNKTSVKESETIKHIDTTATSAVIDNSNNSYTNKNSTTNMRDMSFVSPVQGAVQQARASYARATPIKRSKKIGVSKRPSLKKKKNVVKKVRKLKKKKQQKKKKLHKKCTKKVKKRVKNIKHKRDIFMD